MGSGKTTIAKELAKIIPYKFVDIDTEIVKQENKSISNIFKDSGENYFRQIETNLLKEILLKDKKIISTGGGIILKEENRSIIKEKGIAFWLYAPAEDVYDRIKEDKDRPLINTSLSQEEIIKTIETMMEARFELYKDTADVIINTSKFSAEDSAKEILNEFKLLM